MVEDVVRVDSFSNRILEVLGTGCVITDRLGLIFDVNSVFLSLTKTALKNQVVNRRIWEFLVLDDGRIVADVDSLCARSDSGRLLCRLNTSDGGVVPVVLWVVSDVSRTGEQCMFLIADRSEVDQLEQKLGKVRSEVDRLHQQKEDFIWQLGHDLKTPLVPLHTLLPMVMKRVSDERTLKLLRVISENVLVMKHRVDEILRLAQLSAFGTDASFTCCKLVDVVERVLLERKSDLEKKGLVVFNEVNPGLVVYGDEAGLEEVFDRLLSFSLSHSSKSRKITVFAMENGDMISVSFEDVESGLSREHCDHLFDEFFKVDASRHDLLDTGLDLSMVKQICERHGGDIMVTSDDDMSGLTFYLTLWNGKEKAT